MPTLELIKLIKEWTFPLRNLGQVHSELRIAKYLGGQAFHLLLIRNVSVVGGAVYFAWRTKIQFRGIVQPQDPKETAKIYFSKAP